MKKINNEKYYLNNGVKSIIFLPLLCWFIIFLIILLKNNDNDLLSLFFNPINTVFGVLFFSIIIYHIHYEVIYLINTYIKNNKINKLFRYFITLITYIIIILVILSILKIYFNSILVL